MIKENQSLPSISDVRDYVFYGRFVSLLSDVNSEICKTIQKHLKAKITFFDGKTDNRKSKKIAVIIQNQLFIFN